MKRTIIVILCLIHFLQMSGQNTSNLYRIVKNGVWGYIDKDGAIVIKPKFLNSRDFSEGLAAVRSNGTYGYIDEKGTMVIPPHYDLALNFTNGIAKVFIDGKPFFIDKKGNIIFQHNYEIIGNFEHHSYAIAVTHSGKYGVINLSGHLIADTVFADIQPFHEGLATVTGLNHLPYVSLDDSGKQVKYEIGILDSLGNWIVPYGKYRRIDPYKNGYAHAELQENPDGYTKWSNNEVIIDHRGNQKFIIPSNKYSFDYYNKDFHDGIAIVYVYSDTLRERSIANRIDYKGAINSSGEIIFCNKDWDRLTSFSDDRAFARDLSKHWTLINKLGIKVCDSLFENIAEGFESSRNGVLPFENGSALVELRSGWCLIDTNGRMLTKPRKFDEDFRNFERHGKILLFSKDISIGNKDYSYCYGFFNMEKQTYVAPTFHDIDIKSFSKDLIYIIKDGLMGYISPDGKSIWKANKSKKSDKYLNIDFMNRGYFYASSKYKKELARYGGWGQSDNQSKPISAGNKLEDKKLQILADERRTVNWQGYRGIKLTVANTSTDTLYFSAQDSRLYMKVQAKDKNGIWRDIEYLPSSWCGNSYHTVFLAPRECWEFSTPIYHGEFKTKMRVELLYKKEANQKKDDVIYSNEYTGYINPGQLWIKQEYTPRGIMDPYND